MASFTCRSFGKCILVGEHAVLRGHPALVVPISSRSLELTYSQGPQSLELRLIGDHGVELQVLVWAVIDKACELKKIKREDLRGTLLLESSLPVGAGMGASAALCVALTRWLGYLGYVEESEYYEFSRQLENMFHGESSGLDIAVALSGQGLKFVRNGARSPLAPSWKPKWFISYSGKRGVTMDAVNKVKNFIAQNPEKGEKVDAQMAQAVRATDEALNMPEEKGFPLLAEALSLAGQCFEEWSLNEGAPAEHIAWLKSQGAVAVKPTGSGGGGYVLSLWKNPPPADIQEKLIPC